MPDCGWCGPERQGACPGHEALSCTVRVDGEVLASLGGIVDADRDYCRVIEAELASEAMYELATRVATESASDGFAMGVA
jgi:hypothetical protein